MNFTFTYRTRGGNLKTEVIVAENRSQAIERLNARGITPTRVQEGGTFPKRDVERVHPSWVKTRGFIFGLGALLAIAVVTWMMKGHSSKDGKSQTLKPKKDPVVLTNANPRKTESKKKPTATNAIATLPSEVVAPTNVLDLYHGIPVIGRTVVTNQSGSSIETVITQDGKSHRIFHQPPRIFHHSTDQYLASLLSMPSGAVMAPLPDMSRENLEDQFMKSLETEIVVLPEDSEKVKELKAKVIAAREEMAALIKNGHKFYEVLQDQRTMINENHETRAMVLRELDQIAKTGDVDAVEKYVRKVNVALGQMGIEEIRIPSSMQRQMKKDSNDE